MGLKENLAALSEQTTAAQKNNKKTLDAIISIAQENALTTSASLGAPTPATTAVARRLTGNNGNAAATKSGGLNANFQAKLNELLKAVGGKATINSGYRSPEKQAQLFADAVKKYGSEAAASKWVAPPGQSNHNKGIAADLAFADSSTKTKIHELAGQYGLYFPLDYEDWHIEPVGSRGS